jgi:hypothetical protein
MISSHELIEGSSSLSHIETEMEWMNMNHQTCKEDRVLIVLNHHCTSPGVLYSYVMWIE